MGELADWSGTAWSTQSSEPRPAVGSPIQTNTIAYDAARAEVVLVQSGPGRFPSPGWWHTFVWRGDRWRRVTPAFSPPGRGAAAMTYDRARARVVMHADATWEFDGATWRAMLTAGQARPRTPGAAMAYDEARRRNVLFGAGPGPETWEWDGTTWTRLMLAVSPSARVGHSMTWDPATRTVVLVGSTSAQQPDELWRFDGASWSLGSRGPSLANGLTAYHEARGYLMVQNEETWLLTDQPAMATRYGQGCSIGSTPSLTARGAPSATEPGFGLELTSIFPMRPAAILLSATTAHVPFGNCTVYVGAPFLTLALGTGRTGLASMSLPIPLSPQLRGAHVFAQAGVAESFGLVASHGLALRIGD